MGIKFKNPMVKNIWALISLQDCKIKGGGKIITFTVSVIDGFWNFVFLILWGWKRSEKWASILYNRRRSQISVFSGDLESNRHKASPHTVW